MSVFVCLSLCPQIQTPPNFLRMLYMSVARYSSDGVAIGIVLSIIFHFNIFIYVHVSPFHVTLVQVGGFRNAFLF